MGKKYSTLDKKGADEKNNEVIGEYKKIKSAYAKEHGINLEKLKEIILCELRKIENIGEKTSNDDGKITICLSKVSERRFLQGEKHEVDSGNIKTKLLKWNGGNLDCYYSSKDDRFLIVCKNGSDMAYTDYSWKDVKKVAPYDPHRNAGKSRFYTRNKSKDNSMVR